MTVINLFSGFAPAPTAELVDVLVQTGRCRLQRIVSTGHARSPNEWYDQDTNEWGALLRGSAGLRLEDHHAAGVLRPGDHPPVPAPRPPPAGPPHAASPTARLAPP